ncbi:uncharacterized protein KY384_008948 [Bacidia gigantensis]|uniref:uncharacterized protein n=1 Tax=Bacidia gigantensis TaxID=2732470 RepID=UPI001D059BA2|nr:uncharacterized protein KY384_008948 [Bacidia gigantensis]KAG8525304.1 hypothetical protein KY384_008948 [Bacidia gigantensis]
MTFSTTAGDLQTHARLPEPVAAAQWPHLEWENPVKAIEHARTLQKDFTKVHQFIKISREALALNDNRSEKKTAAHKRKRDIPRHLFDTLYKSYNELKEKLEDDHERGPRPSKRARRAEPTSNQESILSDSTASEHHSDSSPQPALIDNGILAGPADEGVRDAHDPSTQQNGVGKMPEIPVKDTRNVTPRSPSACDGTVVGESISKDGETLLPSFTRPQHNLCSRDCSSSNASNQAQDSDAQPELHTVQQQTKEKFSENNNVQPPGAISTQTTTSCKIPDHSDSTKAKNLPPASLNPGPPLAAMSMDTSEHQLVLSTAPHQKQLNLDIPTLRQVVIDSYWDQQNFSLEFLKSMSIGTIEYLQDGDIRVQMISSDGAKVKKLDCAPNGRSCWSRSLCHHISLKVNTFLIVEIVTLGQSESRCEDWPILRQELFDANTGRIATLCQPDDFAGFYWKTDDTPSTESSRLGFELSTFRLAAEFLTKGIKWNGLIRSCQQDPQRLFMPQCRGEVDAFVNSALSKNLQSTWQIFRHSGTDGVYFRGSEDLEVNVVWYEENAEPFFSPKQECGSALEQILTQELTQYKILMINVRLADCNLWNDAQRRATIQELEKDNMSRSGLDCATILDARYGKNATRGHGRTMASPILSLLSVAQANKAIRQGLTYRDKKYNCRRYGLDSRFKVPHGCTDTAKKEELRRLRNLDEYFPEEQPQSADSSRAELHLPANNPSGTPAHPSDDSCASESEDSDSGRSARSRDDSFASRSEERDDFASSISDPSCLSTDSEIEPYAKPLEHSKPRPLPRAIDRPGIAASPAPVTNRAVSPSTQGRENPPPRPLPRAVERPADIFSIPSPVTNRAVSASFTGREYPKSRPVPRAVERPDVNAVPAPVNNQEVFSSVKFEENVQNGHSPEAPANSFAGAAHSAPAHQGNQQDCSTVKMEEEQKSRLEIQEARSVIMPVRRHRRGESPYRFVTPVEEDRSNPAA